MGKPLPNARPKLLAVTADRQTWQHVAAAVGGWYDVISATTADAATDAVRARADVAAVVVHHAGRGDELLTLLHEVRVARPLARRVVATDFTDLRPIVLGLHAAAIQAVVGHPIVAADLQAAVRSPQAAALPLGMPAVARPCAQTRAA